MLLFVGLGNPGSRYAANRHNIGFMAVEAIARRHEPVHWGNKFQSKIGGGSIVSQRILYLMPGTFMNESGRAVSDVAHFYQLRRDQIIVFHDEVELPLAKVRLKTGGSDAGHNGLRSITAHIGPEYKRVRIGVGRPAAKHLMYSYVLGDFSKSERPWVEALCEIMADNAGLLVERKDSSFQNKVHLGMEAKGFGDDAE